MLTFPQALQYVPVEEASVVSRLGLAFSESFGAGLGTETF